jgi:hypothetical protein
LIDESPANASSWTPAPQTFADSRDDLWRLLHQELDLRLAGDDLPAG